MQYGGITFSGTSGEKYYFQAWSLETRFKSFAAVYFVTKRMVEKGTYRRASHEEIYIGQTESLANPFATQSKFDCFKKHGANCVCICLVTSEEQRIAIEQDLLAGHQTTCN